jgi:ATP-grasp domain
VAIVDPYSSGALLAPAFSARGRECVAVQSTRAVPSIFRSSFSPYDFAAVLPVEDDVAKTVARLRRLGVRHVLAGSEPGVELADELSERLGLPANGPALRAARRDKSSMAAAVEAHGLRVPAQLCSPRFEELRDWVHSRGAWPVVVKPPKSVASDSVAVCRNDDDLERAFGAVFGQTNILGLVNESVLVQEFAAGPEYVVDTVSHDARHRVAAVWRYHRPQAGFRPGVFYAAMELLPYAGKLQQALIEYTIRVLDALEIRYGPAHTELIWNAGGPVLVESGARLSAGNNAVLSRLCGGPCPLDLTVDACVEPEQFLTPERAPRLTGTALNCFLIPPEGHRMRRRPPLQEVRRLPSFHSMSISRRPHRRPVVGVVTLIHRKRGVARDDLRRLRRLERTMFYEPAAPRRRGTDGVLARPG